MVDVEKYGREGRDRPFFYVCDDKQIDNNKTNNNNNNDVDVDDDKKKGEKKT